MPNNEPHSSNAHPSQDLKFITLTTGHADRYSRSLVPDHAVATLRPVVNAGGGTVAGWNIRLRPQTEEGARTFELHWRGRHLTTCYVAWTHDGSRSVWSTARTHSTLSGARHPRKAPDQLPWLAAAIVVDAATPSFQSMDDISEYFSAMSEIADLEQCIAWTIIEAATEGEMPEGTDASVFERTRRPEPVLLAQDGAHLTIGPEGMTVHVQMHDIMRSEVQMLRTGQLDLGVLTSGTSGILLMRFQSVGPHAPMVLETPFHIGLLPSEHRHLVDRPEGHHRTLIFVIQDSTGRPHGGRLVTLPPTVCETLERIVRRQADAAGDASWHRSLHDREVDEFYRRYPDVSNAADRLFRRAHAHQTLH